MQIIHDSSAKKPMQVVDDGKEEKLKEFNAEEALETVEESEQPEETADADEPETQEANVEEEKEEEVVETKSEPAEEKDEEEQPKKKSRLQRRIDDLVRQKSVYENERNQYASRIAQLEGELQKNNTLNKDYKQLQKNHYESRLESAEKLLEKARSEHKSAHEAGDSEGILRAAESIADAKVEIKSLENQKHLFDAPEPETPVYPSVTPQAQQQPTEQQAAQQPDPRALQWAQTNSWFGQDAAKTGAAYAIDAQLKMEGYNPSSEEYYSELDRRLEDAFPVMKKEVKPPKQVVASVSRGQSAPKKVSLTPNQLAMAKRLGVPPTEYAKFVRNTNDQ